MITLLEALQDNLFEPVGITHQSSPELPKTSALQQHTYEVYFVNHQQLPIPPEGRFPKAIRFETEVFDKESLLSMSSFYPGMEARYASRIHEMADHPQGWAGHEHRLRISLSELEAAEFRAASVDFNLRRQFAVAKNRALRMVSAAEILGVSARLIAQGPEPKATL